MGITSSSKKNLCNPSVLSLSKYRLQIRRVRSVSAAAYLLRISKSALYISKLALVTDPPFLLILSFS